MRNESGGATTILVVDDNEMILDLAQRHLEDTGYFVVTTADGSEGLSYYRDNWQKVSVVILDIIMPVMGGRKTFAEMKRINPQIKAVLTTGYCVDCEAQTIMDEGASELLLKPYSMYELSNVIDKLINSEITTCLSP